MNEPTNDLDLETMRALEEQPKFYGTLIVSSHDRYFLDQVASNVLVLKPEIKLNHIEVTLMDNDGNF